MEIRAMTAERYARYPLMGCCECHRPFGKDGSYALVPSPRSNESRIPITRTVCLDCAFKHQEES